MPPLILVTNDDGVHSSGLIALFKAMKELGYAYVVAPDRERSAVGHALTLHRPLKVEEMREHVYSVNGTPTDCVALAVHKTMAAFLVVMTYSALRDAGAAKQELQASLAQLPDIDAVVTSHESRKAEFERYVPFINILNQGAKAPDPAVLLSAFPGLDTNRITFSLINITPSDGALKVRLEGSVRASSYSSTPSYFEKFAASFSKIKGAQMVEQRLLIKERTFLMEVDCR